MDTVQKTQFKSYTQSLPLHRLYVLKAGYQKAIKLINKLDRNSSFAKRMRSTVFSKLNYVSNAIRTYWLRNKPTPAKQSKPVLSASVQCATLLVFFTIVLLVPIINGGV